MNRLLFLYFIFLETGAKVRHAPRVHNTHLSVSLASALPKNHYI